MYVPSFSTVTDVASIGAFVVGSINFAGLVAVGVITASVAFPASVLNTTVSFCSFPCTSIEVFGSAVISFFVTFGI